MMLVNAYPHPQTYQSQEILHKFRNKVTVVELHAVWFICTWNVFYAFDTSNESLEDFIDNSENNFADA